jgi:hypothetical protein
MTKVKSAAQVVKDKVNDTHLSASRSNNDTIRLWENYKDQALMWRSIALLQVPATSLAVLFAIVMWATREITLQVPSKPLPGQYDVSDIPDTEFINVANDYVNLIATYQPGTARKQFEYAASMLKEPLLTKFNQEMRGPELAAIENTSRTQVFFVDPLKTKVTRENGRVIVAVTGERWKVISGAPLPTVTSRFRVEMSTVPRNSVNPFGIVIQSVSFKPNIRGERPSDVQAEEELMGVGQ